MERTNGFVSLRHRPKTSARVTYAIAEVFRQAFIT
jgi:hypothetical protein